MKRVARWSLGATGLASAFVAWHLFSLAANSLYVPGFEVLREAFAREWLWRRMVTDLLPSMARFTVGMAIAAVAGIALGTVLGSFQLLRLSLDPVIDFIRSLPKPALLPLAIVLLGVGDGMQVAFIAFGALWPILINTMDGVKGMDPELRNISRIYSIRGWRYVLFVLLPSASPQIMVGLRVSVAIGLVLMVLSEMSASTNGLGYFILLSQQTFAIANMWTGIFIIGLMGFVVTSLFTLIEARVMRWKRDSTSDEAGPARRSRPSTDRKQEGKHEASAIRTRA